jgi:hypothetical protein
MLGMLIQLAILGQGINIVVIIKKAPSGMHVHTYILVKFNMAYQI